MTFFSVVVPVFNRENFIKLAIDSILNQDTNDFEIIVIDDGSTDNTIDILNQYNHKIKILKQENQGPAKARNLGIHHAIGKYICFLDSDDIWFPWTLSTFKKVIDASKALFISGQRLDFEDIEQVPDIIKEDLRMQIFPDYFFSSKHNILLLPSAVTIERETLIQSGCFVDKWINGEDSDLWMKLGLASPFVVIDSPIVLGYRRHPNSAIANHQKTFLGAIHLIEQEKQGLYLGGEQRKSERTKILTSHIRPVSLTCLKIKEYKKALHLYKETFIWNLQEQRSKYILGFFAIFIFVFLKNILNNKLNEADYSA